MAVRHEQRVATDPGDAAAFRRAEMHGDVLADSVAVADLQARATLLVGPILRRSAESSATLDIVIVTDDDLAEAATNPDVRSTTVPAPIETAPETTQ